MTTRPIDYVAAKTLPSSWADRMTVEAALYAGVFGIALFLRLFRLGLVPLSESEAAQAVAALHGTVLPPGDSPSLYAINSLLLSIFSPSDALVRIVPAVIGSTLVLLPALFRDAIGRWGALGASLILALSPVALAASRSLDGEVITVACVIVLVALVRRYQLTRDERDLIGAAVVLGVGLASGTGMYTALLALGASWIVLRVALRDDTARGSPLVFPNRTKVIAVVVGAFVLAATGVLTKPSGLAAAGDVLMAWLGGFGAPSGSSAFDIIQVLAVYELLALIVGAIGAGRALMRADRFGAWLGFAAIIGLSIIIVQPGRQPIDLLLPVALLALLAGYAIQPWAEAQAKAALTVDGVIVAIGAAMSGVLILLLTSYLRNALQTAVQVQPNVFVLAMFIVLPGLIGLLLSTMYEVSAVLRGAATLGLALLALGSFGAGWGATQVRVGDPHEIIWGQGTTSMDVRALVMTAEQVAIRTQGHARTLPFRVEVDDSVVAWYFRDAQPPVEPAPGVVTLYGSPPQSGDAKYVGARFTLRGTWDALGLSSEAWLEWALFRTGGLDQPLTTQAVTVWQKK